MSILLPCQHVLAPRSAMDPICPSARGRCGPAKYQTYEDKRSLCVGKKRPTVRQCHSTDMRQMYSNNTSMEHWRSRSREAAFSMATSKRVAMLWCTQSMSHPRSTSYFKILIPSSCYAWLAHSHANCMNHRTIFWEEMLIRLCYECLKEFLPGFGEVACCCIQVSDV